MQWRFRHHPWQPGVLSTWQYFSRNASAKQYRGVCGEQNESSMHTENGLALFPISRRTCTSTSLECMESGRQLPAILVLHSALVTVPPVVNVTISANIQHRLIRSVGNTWLLFVMENYLLCNRNWIFRSYLREHDASRPGHFDKDFLDLPLPPSTCCDGSWVQSFCRVLLMQSCLPKFICCNCHQIAFPNHVISL
jgi:hypothetical protein